MPKTPRHLLLSLLVAAVSAVSAQAADVAGTWQIQSMGSDRDVLIEQQGQRIVAHRVMWPQFEGQKYRLEHLYRGAIEGTRIRGELLVKEEGLAEFEILRTFEGAVRAPDDMTLDGMPIARTAPVNAAPKKPEPAAPPATVANANPPPSLEDDPGVALYGNIMGGAAGQLFKISATVQIADEVRAATEEADALYAKGKFAAALVKYQDVAKEESGARVELLHRMGRCHLKLHHMEEARSLLGRALRLDPNNSDIKRDYAKSKQKR